MHGLGTAVRASARVDVFEMFDDRGLGDSERVGDPAVGQSVADVPEHGLAPVQPR